ncbi:sigma factor G inhibitor Gin [Pontibacillus marinus]|uniref:CsfB n=1 Tax=Pontibacillus marinus BH030004 = DSM 16465 TaxID=1385511 RepID=A0A0A5FRQ9_9BACI|nr:sigma factor G inhibitor Gin [Pontibacillus marinus]KGX83451.1 CsfB [Pontibacillus marinus BH030004 = DSM 16465]
MNGENKMKMCGICDTEKDQGIHLYNMFICYECEREIIQTEPSEQKYHYFLKKMRTINQTTQYS